MKRTNIYLDKHQHQKLLRLADKGDVTTSRLIRTYIDKGIEETECMYRNEKSGIEALYKLAIENPIKTKSGLDSTNYKDFLYGNKSKWAKPLKMSRKEKV